MASSHFALKLSGSNKDNVSAAHGHGLAWGWAGISQLLHLASAGKLGLGAAEVRSLWWLAAETQEGLMSRKLPWILYHFLGKSSFLVSHVHCHPCLLSKLFMQLYFDIEVLLFPILQYS